MNDEDWIREVGLPFPQSPQRWMFVHSYIISDDEVDEIERHVNAPCFVKKPTIRNIYSYYLSAGIKLEANAALLLERIHAKYTGRRTSCQMACAMFLHSSILTRDLRKLICKRYIYPSKYDAIWIGTEIISPPTKRVA